MKILKIFLLLIISSAVFAQSGPEITTVLKEKFTDKNGNPLTGKGIIIGDMDSGIDVFHPFFFFADGGEFNWIDVNGDGKFTPGIDGIDLNNDGQISDTEILNYMEISNKTMGSLKSNRNIYNPDMDFLYNDKNKNGQRDYGEQAGFSESDPTYGEQFFIPSNFEAAELIPGEKIIGLKTSKVISVRQKDGSIRRRGIDLIKNEGDDEFNHGTSVAGLLLGGINGLHKLHGLAPDAELVMAGIKYDYTPRFVKNFPDLMNFVKGEGANVILFEDGEWAWEPMDGTSPEEILARKFCEEGLPVVTATGNLAAARCIFDDMLTPDKKFTYTVTAADVVEGKVNNGAFVSFYYKGNPGDFSSVEVIAPDDKSYTIPTKGSGFLKSDYRISYEYKKSEKGNILLALGFYKKDSASIGGDWKINLESKKNLAIRGSVGDISQSWGGYTHWKNRFSTVGTLTFPATADSTIKVGAYVVNFAWQEKAVGEIATYSGRGPAITGDLGIDICAPGHTTFAPGTHNSYVIFSGTSSAAPHVTGLIALMLQYDKSLTNSQIKSIIRNTAMQEGMMGTLPNPIWGWGKLNIPGALKNLTNQNN